MNYSGVLRIVFLMSVLSDAYGKIGHNVYMYKNVNGKPGPDDWPNQYPACRGRSQSPIDIRTEATIYSPYLTEFIFSRPSPRSKFIVHNNGHAIQVNTEGNFYLHRGGLGNVYSTVQLHFHWGDSDQHGSEHTVNGASYPLEMHIVNWNSDKYVSVAEAMKHKDGIAVLGVHFEISTNDNTVLDPIIQAIQQVTDPDWDNRVELTAMSIRNLLPKNACRYYRYHGSLTTPECQESVIWTVFAEKLTISERQLSVFRRCLQPTSNGHGSSSSHSALPQQGNATPIRESLVNNYRPVQPLHGRHVYRSYSLWPGAQSFATFF
ncbi:carbonic anhydrase 1-like [Mercenaria mercenaria]|uniref:carbonic anhydrase 1-like n=1 Tax=Mercenaria mercenaria TaxID=6596 RepID=UPI00234E6625|nr:carbonic anhydrase 1-like [Mercenaria mercenaria]